MDEQTNTTSPQSGVEPIDPAHIESKLSDDSPELTSEDAAILAFAEKYQREHAPEIAPAAADSTEEPHALVEYIGPRRHPFALEVNRRMVWFGADVHDGCPPWIAVLPLGYAQGLEERFPNLYRICEEQPDAVIRKALATPHLLVLPTSQTAKRAELAVAHSVRSLPKVYSLLELERFIAMAGSYSDGAPVVSEEVTKSLRALISRLQRTKDAAKRADTEYRIDMIVAAVDVPVRTEDGTVASTDDDTEETTFTEGLAGGDPDDDGNTAIPPSQPHAGEGNDDDEDAGSLDAETDGAQLI